MKTPFLKSFAVLTIIGLVAAASGIAIPLAPAANADVVLVAVAITASPNTICAGQSSVLTWSSTDATSVSIDQGIGAVAPFGEMRVSPTQTTTYTITGTNSTRGHGTARATVFVGGGSCPNPGTPTPAPTRTPTPVPTAGPVLVAVAITAAPNTICAGQSSRLTWSSTDATSISINQGIGSVTPFGERNVSPTQTTTYTITGTNSTGGSATAHATVFVRSANECGSTPGPVLVAVAITASPSTICVGQSARLTWSSTDATSIHITDIGSVTPFGERNVSPTQTTTYVITGSNSTGGTATARATVTVRSGNDCSTPNPVPGAISIQKLGRNITRGGVSELSSVTIGANNTVEFTIRVRSLSSTTLNNVIVSDALPAGLTYIMGSTVVNGNLAPDSITNGGINIGSLVPGTEAVIRFRALVGAGSTFPNGARTAYNIASVRADNTPTASAQLPLTYGTILRTVSGVKTGAAGTALMALLLSGLLTFGYMAYTRTNIFVRRDAAAAVKRSLGDKQRFNFARFF